MTMFTVYFDGSGSPDDTVALAVAGFIAPADQWIEFERNWNDCLTAFGVSSLHMRHYAHSRGEFTSSKGDKHKRDRFMGRLISIIKSRVWHSFASAVVMDGYRKIDAKYCLGGFAMPYALAGGTCIEKVERWKARRGRMDDEIAYFFEDGDTDKGDLMRIAKERLGFTLQFLKKEQSAAFQAADLLAYEHFLINVRLRKSEKNELFEDEVRYPLMELSKIPGGSQQEDDWGVHSEDNLAAICVEYRVPLRHPL